MKNRVVILLLFLFICSVNVYAADYEYCQMSDAYREWLSLSDKEKKETSEPLYCDGFYTDTSSSTFVTKTIVNGLFKTGLGASANDTRYNAAENNLVTTPKNQKSSEACWAFSTNSLLETQLLKKYNITADLSEAHVEYSTTYDPYSDSTTTNSGEYYRNLNDGGNYFMAAAYLFNHDGSISENKMPIASYIGTSGLRQIASNEMVTSEAMVDVDKFEYSAYTPTSTSDSSCKNHASQLQTLKQQVIKYGSVGISIYYSGAYLNVVDGVYYYNYSSGGVPSNHAVTVVGWDDTISASNFKNATNDGALIVKNSWGSTWGNNGYFYISYDDIRACNSIYNYDAKSNTYENAYSSNKLYFNSYAISSNQLYTLTKFSKKSPSGTVETLDKLSFGVVANNYYSVYVIKNQSDINDIGKWTLVGQYVSSYNGIQSITFDPIEITGDFAIAVQYETNATIPLTCKSTSTSSMYYTANLSGNTYYGQPGSWNAFSADDSSSVAGCDTSVYAYTTQTEGKLKSYYYNIGTDNVITVDMADELVLTLEEFKQKVTYDTDYDVVSPNGNTITSGNVPSGSTITIDGSTYTIIIPGDANQDGKITSMDYIDVKLHIQGIDTITDSIRISSADANQDGKISALDYVEIRLMILNNWG